MFAQPTTHRLKALRDQAGLSVRSMAASLGMSSSGYSHYENPARFKEQYLPMRFALDVAAVLEARGIPRAHVMDLAGPTGTPNIAPQSGSAPGFSEGAASEWLPAPNNRSRVQQIIHALAPGAGNPGTFRVSRDLAGLGLLRGDILVIDRRALPAPGQLALGNALDEGGELVTVVGRYLPPMLFTPDTLTSGQMIDVTSERASVYHPILASFRLNDQSME